MAFQHVRDDGPHLRTQTEEARADLATARSVIENEANALHALINALDERFVHSVETILACTRHTIVTGVGKSGHVGMKIAASFASTGTPAFFVHPTEASHGDLGMIVPGCCVLAISYSGESRELTDLLRYCAGRDVPVIGITRAADSTLGRLSRIHLPVPSVRESCPNGLAPTASTTMTMALGDALTIALMDRRGFSREEFGLRHPGGKLGKQLQTVADYLATKPLELPKVATTDDVHVVIATLADGRVGCVAVVSDEDRYLGIITDGDLRRAIKGDIATATAQTIMCSKSTTFEPSQRMAEVVRIMSERRITNGFVLEDGRAVGALHIKNLLAEGYL